MPTNAGNRTRCCAVGLAAVVLLSSLAGCGGASGEPEAVGGPPLLRRLTESQYRASVADIFGASIPIAARFERGLRVEGLVAIGSSQAGMSAFSVEQYDAAALGVAAAVVGKDHRAQLVPCAPAAETEFDQACATRFVERYGERLFRRPLTAEETGRFVEAARGGHARLGNFYRGLEFALAGMMVSPDFLLRIERASADSNGSGLRQLDAYSKASRLAYFLTNSTPDGELLRAAGAGELDSSRGLKRQVDRLIASPRFERALRAVFADMLEFDLFADLAKDPQVYPAFNSTVAADAQEQTLRTITDHLIAQRGDYRGLFTTRRAYLTRALGVVYRLPVPTRNGWEASEFPQESHRAGIHSHVSFLALHSHPGRSSPTLRGKAMREVFLCQEVPDPPANVNFSIVEASNQAMPTARDRLLAHRTEPSCAGCHMITDPIGLTLENFDGLGHFRTLENQAPIDAGGSLDGTDFNNPEGLAQALHDHPETPRCLVEKMYRFAAGRDTTIEERPYMDFLLESFKANGYRVPDLMRTIALSRNFFAIAPAADRPPDDAPHSASTSSEGDRS